MEEDNIRNIWYEKNEIKYIGLFYFILMKLRHKDISGNLSWIIPGILNLMDDTDHLEEVKLPAIQLFHQLLVCFSNDNDNNDFNRWIQIQDTGIYNLFEPILKKMLFFTPPSFKPENTLKIWSTVYPTLIKLYQLQFNYNQHTAFNKEQYNDILVQLCSEVILQHNIPRCEGLKYEKLLLFALDQLTIVLRLLGASSVILLQRIIYVIGENIVKDHYFTLFDHVVDKIIEFLKILIVEIIPKERIEAHKFDLFGILVMITIKCDAEGKLEKDRLEHLQEILKQMEIKSVSVSQMKDYLIIENYYKDIITKLFIYEDN